MSKTAQDPEAAWEFIKFFTADDGVMYWADYRSGNAPVVNRRYYRQWTEQFQTRYSLTLEDVYSMLEGSNYFWDVPLLISPNWTQIQGPFIAALTAVAKGEKSTAQAMGEIETTINTLLKEAPFTW